MQAPDEPLAATSELGRQWLLVAQRECEEQERSKWFAQEEEEEEDEEGEEEEAQANLERLSTSRNPSSGCYAQIEGVVTDRICRRIESQERVRTNQEEELEHRVRADNTQDTNFRNQDGAESHTEQALAADANKDKLAKTIDYVRATGADYLSSSRANGRKQSESTSSNSNSNNNNNKQIGLHEEQDGQQRRQTASSKPAPGSASPQQRGLLEALLGERGRSWFEHKTVILDIKNGNKKDLDETTRSESVQQAEPTNRPGKQTEASSPAPTTTTTRTQVPTFGSVPQKLLPRRLPYFTYHGQAKNVEIERASDRFKVRGQPTAEKLHSGRQHASSVASSLSGASSSGSSSSSSARPRTGRASLLGYSNISNLFPNEPVQTRPTSRQQQYQSSEASHKLTWARPIIRKSASLLSLQTAPNQADRSRYVSNTRPRQEELRERRKSHFSALSPVTQQQTATESEARPRQRQLLQASRSQQSLLTAANRPAAMSTMRRQQQPGVAKQQARPAGGRPMSATGNYIAGGGGGGRFYRSPSSNSLQRHASSYRLGSAGMSPLVDPDCPVHGDHLLGHESPPQTIAARRRYQYGTYGPKEPIDHKPAGYSSSQPDLQYGWLDADYEPLHDPYNRYANEALAYAPAAAGAGKSPQDYSPVSPPSHPTGGRYTWTPSGKPGASNGHLSGSQRGAAQRDRGQPAYYNSSSRFSLYHPSDGGVRPSLAPPSEQLRRILGYKPAPAATRPVHLHPQWAYTKPFIHLKPAGSGFGASPVLHENGIELEPDEMDESIRFAPFNRLQDSQAIRAVDFHPGGQVYAIGSNSRSLRICAYPAEHELRHFDPPEHNEPVKAPRVLFKFLQVHRGSIYCVAFNPSGQLLATGSNDQTVHIVKYNSVTHNPDGEEFRLTMHNGTVRDLCFIDDSSGNGSSLLLSAGGGDNKIYVTDTQAVTPFQSMAGHTQMVMSLQHCGGAQFASGSYDRTIRLWDLRSRSCTSIVSAPPTSSSSKAAGGATGAAGPGAPVCSLCVDPSGRLLVSGHSDSTCMLYDIRGGKIIQTFRPHDDEIRAISFSPKSYYLMTGGYDGRLVVSDLQGDLTQALPSVCVAETQDKIVQTKWHTEDFTFVSTSAGGAATLWSLPGEIRN